MSWDVQLLDANGEVVPVERHSEGGTYALGGLPAAELNVTYNYGALFSAAFDGLGFRDALDSKQAGETIGLLERGVERLGIERACNYWASTEGNAGHALSTLLGWARQHPDATWRVL